MSAHNKIQPPSIYKKMLQLKEDCHNIQEAEK